MAPHRHPLSTIMPTPATTAATINMPAKIQNPRPAVVAVWQRVLGARILSLTTVTLLVACDRTPTPRDPLNDREPPIMSTSSSITAAAVVPAPKAPVRIVTDSHWGVEVQDPYRYLEDQDALEVVSWFKGQAAHAQAVLGQLPQRDALYARLVELDEGAPYTTFGVRQLANGGRFYLRRNAGENLAKLYYQPSPKQPPQLLIDPENLSAPEEQHYALGGYMPSSDGRIVVYGLAQGGSEQTTYHLLDVLSGEPLDAPISHIETAYNRPMWSADNRGFFYSRRQDLPDDANDIDIYKKTEVRHHVMGTDPKDDALIVGFGHSSRLPLLDTDFPSLWLTPDSAHAVLKVKHGDNNEISLFTAPVDQLLDDNIPWVRIANEADWVSDFAVKGEFIYLLTARDAPRYQLLKTALSAPRLDTAQAVIGPSDRVLSGVAAAKDALYVETKRDGVSGVLRLTQDGTVTPLVTPRGGAGYISGISPHVDGILLYESAWIQGGVRYAYDPKDNTFTDTGMVPKGQFDNLDGLVAKEVLVPSHDGTPVPLSILHRADLVLDGSHPTIVYGYGSYGISMDQNFSPLRLAWLERGGVYAIAHVRGGGEYGQEWHYAGRMGNKPNTWLDLIACAEYLVRESYTAPAHMAPMGGSAGGILAGRSVTTRPDLFGAAVMQVGMLDAIRAETTTNGVPNIKEFGTVTEEDGFEHLLAMSAYHQVDERQSYPATLLTHGYNDSRVNVWMSGKMAAKLQAANGDEGPPVLLRVDFDAGHGIGSTRAQVLEQIADIYAFLFWQLGGN